MSSLAQTRVAPAAVGSSRLEALDFTKGALVLFMLLYHWLNYFFAPDGDIYKYLRFVTPSFICITGFLVTNIYGPKFARDPGVPLRLLRRGFKILALFIGLNLCVGFLLRNSYDGKILFADLSARNLSAIYLTGNVVVDGGKAAAFYILVPISYLLLLSAGLLLASKVYRHVFAATLVAFLLFVAMFSLSGIKVPNLEWVTVGLLGALVGFLPKHRIDEIVNRPIALAAAYMLYLAVITVWNVFYPFLLVGVLLTLSVLYLVGSRWTDSTAPRNLVVLVGQYSLFGYIAQIAILQILYRVLRHITTHGAPTFGAPTLALSFVAAFLMTVTAVVVLDRARLSVPTVDRMYRAVFA